MFQFWVDFVKSLKRTDDSAKVAAGRLKGSVFLDRLSLSPATLDQIRCDVVRSLSRYLVIDENAMTLAVEAQGRTVALAASIPVVRPREGGLASEGYARHETHEISRAPSAPAERTHDDVSRDVAQRANANPLDARRPRGVRRRRTSRRLGIQP